MFFTGSQARESALANRRLAASAQDFRNSVDSWYDGTVASVDRRITACQRLLHAAESALGRSPFDIEPLQIMGELQEDYRALTGMRHDLLTGYQDRAAGKHDDPWGEFGTHHVEETDVANPPEVERIHTPGYGDRTVVKRVPKEGAVIDDDERRWAVLEAPRFLRANIDVARVPDELTTRANHWAAKICSGFDHPVETRRLFVSRVLDEAMTLPPRLSAPPLRLANRKIIDIEPEAMFL